MSTSYSSKAKIGTPAVGDTGYTAVFTANANRLDGMTPVGGLMVTTREQPTSSSLLIDVAAGLYVTQAGAVATYAGATSQAVTASATTYVYLTGAGALTLSTSGWPAAGTPYVPLATVAAGASAITSVADQRPCFAVVGAGFLPLSGGTLTDGANLALGAATGTQIGTAATQKLGFYGKAPAAQPSGPAQSALTDSTGGTVGTTLAAVGATNSGDVSGTINANFASINNLVAALRSALVAEGLIKGSA